MPLAPVDARTTKFAFARVTAEALKSLPAMPVPPVCGVPSSLGSISVSSVRHVALQPSTPRVLPSSHCSGTSMKPSPHVWARITQVEGMVPLQLQPGSTVHVALQPSVPIRSPSSHPSVLALSPSPHVVVHTEGVPAQVKANSTMQVALQPSPAATLPPPWSQVSRPSRSPSPQMPVQAEGVVPVHA